MGNLRRAISDSLKSIIVGILLCIFAGLPAFAAENVKNIGVTGIANVKSFSGTANANIKSISGVDSTGGGGGTPDGNAFTHVAGSPRIDTGNSDTSNGIGGAIGDVLIAIVGWEDTGTITAITHSTEGALTLGTAVAANGVGCIYGWKICAGTAQGTLTPTASGSVLFRDWYVIRASATGTISVSNTANMRATGTGTAVSVGPYTTATVNGMLLAMVKVDNSSTFSAEAFGGTGATEDDIAGTSTPGFRLLHSAAQTGANFTTTINTSVNWATQVLSVTAQ